MKFIYILFIASVSLFSASKDLLMLNVTHYNKTATSLSLQDAELSYEAYAASYMSLDQDYILFLGLKYSPKQKIGVTALGSTPIGLEQEGWKYELGAGYKFHLTDKLYIAPALLFSDYYSSLYKIVGNTVSKSDTHDNDLRLYGLLGYKLRKSTMFFCSVELNNDLLHNDYSKDYSQYTTSATLYQFLSKKWFFYIKYQQSLRDKEATDSSTGNRDSKAYGIGTGMTF